MKLFKKVAFICLIVQLIISSGCSLSTNLPREKPKDFNIIFNYGVGGKNKLDTVHDEFTRDMIEEPEITTKMKLSDEEMNNIYSELRKINILKYAEEFKPEYQNMSDPFQTYSLKVIYEGKEKIISREAVGSSRDRDAVQLKALFDKIEEIIRSKEEYKKLPEPKGGYE